MTSNGDTRPSTERADDSDSDAPTTEAQRLAEVPDDAEERLPWWDGVEFPDMTMSSNRMAQAMPDSSLQPLLSAKEQKAKVKMDKKFYKERNAKVERLLAKLDPNFDIDKATANPQWKTGKQQKGPETSETSETSERTTSTGGTKCTDNGGMPVNVKEQAE